jgi:hypothetical protein
MPKIASYTVIAIALAVVCGVICCKKKNDINSTGIIAIPYSLYVADSMGALYHTNDGKTFTQLFGQDGTTVQGLVIADTNVIWIKNIVFYSNNGGVNFNPSYSYVTHATAWREILYNVPDEGRVYLCTIYTNSKANGNGVVFSETGGLSWAKDTVWATTITGNVAITSFTQLSDGTVLAYDNTNNRIFYRANRADHWHETTTGVTLLPAATFFISHYGAKALACDYGGTWGVWYSNDKGSNWTQYHGLPTTKHILCANAPQNVLMAGTDSMGLYVYNDSTQLFARATNGFDTTVATSVYGMVAKTNIYMDGTTDNFIYVAASTGIYRSSDMGKTWTMLKAGNYVAIY